MTTAPPHPDWLLNDTPLGKELLFCPQRSGAAFLVPVITGLIFAGASAWGMYVLLTDWISGAPLLGGGVVLFILLLGCMLFAVRCLRLALRAESYLLSHGELRAITSKPGFNTEQRIEKQKIIEVLQLYTPAHSRAGGTWRTCLAYSGSSGGSRQELFFEGDSKEVSDWLCEIISEWAAVPLRRENTKE